MVLYVILFFVATCIGMAISVYAFGTEAYSAWNGSLEGKDFVTPEEIRDNPSQK